ncbi:MAG: C40 family peptidase [Hungatella sp.]|nr:C40 family peptidase [Hungatella sp.]
MRIRRLYQGIGLAAVCGCFTALYSGQAMAAYSDLSGPGAEYSNYVAAVEEGNPAIYVSMDSYDVLREAKAGDYYQILGDEGSGWVEIQVGDTVGYISTNSGVSVINVEELEGSGAGAKVEDKITETANEQVSETRRQNLVSYALQFLGCAYRDAGSSPSTGFDCSGFVSYVMRNGAGVSLNRSSRAQATQGAAISSDQMRPGDLIFYGNGNSINHVSMYIGDGQVVHASTYKTGVKTSPWNYRTPIRIVNVLGD